MTMHANTRLYDEDSVFNQLFTKEKKPRRPTQAERMASLFADAPTSEPPFKAADFLPCY